MTDSGLNRFLGGTPGQVALRLLFLSFVVGVILSAIDLDPLRLFDYAVEFISHLWSLGFDAIDGILRYLLLGAAVVVPVWLVLRVLKSIGR